MMKKLLERCLCLLSCLLFCCSSSGIGAVNRHMSTKQFTYQNPIMDGPGWIRDGFILKVGDTYYLTGTTGNAGVRVWSSRSLTKWRTIENGDDGYVLRNEAIPWTNEKIWAPELFYHPEKDKFYLTVNCPYDGNWHRQGLAIAVAENVTGPYELKTVNKPLTGNNDASLFLDDDGQCYLIQTNCVLCKIDLNTPKLLTPKYHIVEFGEDEDDWDYKGAINEGPCIRKVDGTYYVFWTCNRWGNFVGYATSKIIWDKRTNKPPKFVKNPSNPIFGAAREPYEQHEPPGCPFDEAGHGTPFIGPDGRYWISGFCKSFKRGSPYTTPRLFIDPLNYDPQSGEFTGQVTWTPQTVCVPSASKPVQLPGVSATKPRLIILADMGNEPDEEQQMVHMLVNCNEFELEGLIAVTGKFLNERISNKYKRVVHPELFYKLIDGYEKVRPNLCLHASGYPTAESLRAIVAPGQRKYGIADIGKGKSSAGSKLIVKALKGDDPRPLNVVVNAGSNTLAQALWDIRATHSDAELNSLVAKLRVFENGAQDNAGAWICREFPGIHWIRSNHQTYGYMGQGNRVGPYVWQPYTLDNQGQHRWAEQHIMWNHGALGALYPYRLKGNGFLEGGGTIPWLGLVNKGLYDIDQPSWGGWSGRFTATKQRNVWSRHGDVRKDEETYGDFYAYTEVSDRWTDPESGIPYSNEFTPVWRWRRAMLNNCRARFDWCVMPYERANHHPIAAFRGDASDTIVRMSAKAGELVTLDASASSDLDGDALQFRWYVYPEASTYTGSLIISNEANAVAQIAIPEDAAGKQIHVILQVNDENEIVSLYDYRRIVIDVKQPVVRESDWIVSGVETIRGEHIVDWRGGKLITRRSVVGGFVEEDGTPVHTVFHLYNGEWEAVDTTVQYTYGISFHWKEGRGVLKGTRLRAGPRPDAIICSGQADITLIDCDFPIGLGVYVHKGGRTRLDLPTGTPITGVYDAQTLTPGVEWRMDLKNTTVGHWFVFLRNIGMKNPPCEVTLGESKRLIVSLLGHNLTGELNLSNNLVEPVRLGNVTLRRAETSPDISMWALYFSGDKTDLKVQGAAHICELMHRGGRLHLSGTASRNELSIGCTTLELSGTATMMLEHVHLGRPLTWMDDGSMGEANVVGNARLTGNDVSARGVRFHTRDNGRVTINSVDRKGKIEVRKEGGEVELRDNPEPSL